MAGKPDGNATSLSATIEALRNAAEQSISDIQKQADAALKEAASQLVAGGAVIADFVRQGVSVTQQYADQGKGYIGYGLCQLKRAEDAAIAEIKCGLELVQSNPYLSYPLLTTGSLMLLPVTRRFLYRATLGRLRSPDNILKGCEGKVEGLRVKMADYSTEAKKLQVLAWGRWGLGRKNDRLERLVAAEEEYIRGRAKLKATRHELTRLASVVGKSERAAASVLEDLRIIRKLDQAVQLRAEAASQVADLRSQRKTLLQHAERIAKRDI
ncbi:hypothetical protein VOLCADRAFT_93417 [Volvox carteri f. nagariensis]|uniref:Uncharacterized protein n=1 Tax=Volvox carteri f. nagariensis TaxID=3068 RepID=D8U226_VOLCA|nr:uncharacterized protein VOLCADRAFT_93417 [Volvox carteri f. nagariensis]EFJ46208.1 hypothetical protein VOLCADRAFT_93417 [Volvox carteri f. nagariensis]|eukprot:XP_002952655.1 hypothetical protein VOLCADRAFT_93417 [Volvox carteri f. nagariensis]